MTTLRDSLLARLAEIRKVAEAATPGPWWAEGGTIQRRMDYSDGSSGDRAVAQWLEDPDRDFFLAARSVLGPLVEGLAEEVGRHEYGTSHLHRPPPGAPYCVGCYSQFSGSDCGFVRRWADRLRPARRHSGGGDVSANRETLAAALREAMCCDREEQPGYYGSPPFVHCAAHGAPWPCSEAQRVADALLTGPLAGHETPTQDGPDDAAVRLGDAGREADSPSVRDGADSHDVGAAVAEGPSDTEERPVAGSVPAPVPSWPLSVHRAACEAVENEMYAAATEGLIPAHVSRVALGQRLADAALRRAPVPDPEMMVALIRDDFLGKNDDGHGWYGTKAIITNRAIAEGAARRALAILAPLLGIPGGAP